MPLRNLRPDLNGILVIDKPVGWTSTQVCSLIRRRTGRAKVGHAGTLDPLASGILVVCLGRATKLISEIMAGEKEYDGEVDLSARSRSDDLETERESVDVPVRPTLDDIQRVLTDRFLGEISQTPPTFSAIQVGGKRAYDAARRGTPFDLKARTVVVREARVVGLEWPIARIHIRCGKGVYIRSIARDLGIALGTGGMLVGLRRTRVGAFGLGDAIGADQLPERIEADLMRQMPNPPAPPTPPPTTPPTTPPA